MEERRSSRFPAPGQNGYLLAQRQRRILHLLEADDELLHILANIAGLRSVSGRSLRDNATPLVHQAAQFIAQGFLQLVGRGAQTRCLRNLVFHLMDTLGLRQQIADLPHQAGRLRVRGVGAAAADTGLGRLLEVSVNTSGTDALSCAI